MPSSGKICNVILVRTDVSEGPSASIIRVTRIGELVTALSLTSNRRTLRRNSSWRRPLLHKLYFFSIFYAVFIGSNMSFTVCVALWADLFFFVLFVFLVVLSCVICVLVCSVYVTCAFVYYIVVVTVVDWVGLARDRYRWRALVNSEMNLRVS
jgi:hypothetical protein